MLEVLFLDTSSDVTSAKLRIAVIELHTAHSLANLDPEICQVDWSVLDPAEIFVI